ncbi:transmembrane protease serine 5-like isoform X2 [Pristis pectinata]|uniref:transmembrane protease serine 5-like isoform X2 n=1 Tax=Pristis pectinata TaxID=685728 RepID=UPI00223E836D|nr:transmembrane protease serine 5-like isoform X2 [Pristis pectinata]
MMDFNLKSSGTSGPLETQQEDVPLLELTKTDASSAQSSEDPNRGSESILLDSKDDSSHTAKPTELGLPTLEGTRLEAPPKICSENTTQGSESILSDSKNDVVCTIKPAELKEVEVPLLEATTSEVPPVVPSELPTEAVRRRRWRHRFRPRRRPPRATKRILALLCAVTILSMIVVGIYFTVRYLERPIENKNSIPTGGNAPTTDCNATDQNFSSTAPITVSFRINSENSLLEIHNQSWQGWLPACDTKWNSSLGKLVCRYMGHIKYLSSDVLSVSEIERNYTQGFAEITNAQDSNLENIWGYRARCTSGKVIKLKCSACGEKHDFSMIVGGQEATQGSWPWQVTLYYNYKHTCGGSILDQYWLITAAHCVHRLSIAHNWRVYAGIVDRQLILFTSLPTYVVEKIIYHSDYNHDTHDYDIALMKLRKPITFSNTVRAICLPRYNQQIVPDDTENILKEASVPLISTERCNSSCMYNGAITPRMLCAGYREGKVDACQGDSGGPLVCEDISAWHLTGVVSWGIGCAEANHPGVYTKVSEFQEWIYSVIEG